MKVDLTRGITLEMEKAVRDTIKSGQYILGPNVSEFENEVAAYLGVDECIGVANGTDALVIGLLAAGVKTGDEVIVPALSFWATAEAVLSIGAKPVFVDISMLSFNIDYSLILQAITQKTKAILPVHLFGLAAPMSQILDIAKEKELIVVEDMAQAFGATFPFEEGERKVGAIGNVGCMSFFPAKILGGIGDGGMISTSNVAFASRARSYRSHGFTSKHNPVYLGYNSRLDEIQAAFLREKLKVVEKAIARRIEIANFYHENLCNFNFDFQAFYSNTGHRNVFNYFILRTNRRDSLVEVLKKNEIPTAIYYPYAMSSTECAKRHGVAASCPNAELVAQTNIALPIYPEMTDGEVEQVIDVIKGWARGNR